MQNSPIEAYLHDLKQQLENKGMLSGEVMEEIEDHLLESVEHDLRRGLSRPEAEREAVQRFGSAQAIAAAFEKERAAPLQKTLLAVALISGWMIAYVDTRPTWDDTGVTAGAILFTCGLITLLGYRRPWLLALAVGMWIPLYWILVSHNPASILALGFAFAGAYAGWMLRSGVRKVFHSA